jgi:hypothetical protein
LVLEDLNGGIELANVGIESLDVLLVLDVVKIKVLSSWAWVVSIWAEEKWAGRSALEKKLQVRGIMIDGKKRGIK